MRYDLSILIPARNETYISNTVADILKNKRGKTEILVGLDGEWANPGILDHPDVRIVRVSESIGQRALTNRLCRLSKSKYVAKCDAHCAFDEGFDQKMLDMIAGHDDWTVVPLMQNLHVFNWECPKCGGQWYQGPTPDRCMGNISKPGHGTTVNLACDNTTGFRKVIVWAPREGGPHQTSYRFDKTLHFKYFPEFRRRPEGQGDVTPTMSLQGSFFMLTREKYWELNICDEKHGSWGQQGTEVACKTWLSGGKVMVNHNTWYAHMFRTQGGDFTFPYPQSERRIEEARQYSRDLWFNNKFEKQIHPLSWLIEKFAPVPGWTEEIPDKARKGIIYYTDNQLPTKLAHKVQDQLKSIELPITSASLKKMDKMGTNVVVDGVRGYETYFKQILAALEASTSEIVFFCEHDNLMHSSHFDFTPPRKDRFYYDQNWWKVRSDGFAVHWDANQVSGLCCYREHALEWYRNKQKSFYEQIEAGRFDRKFEPVDIVDGEEITEVWKAKYPSIDIRHDRNLTYNKWSLDDFRDKSTAANFQESTIDKIEGWQDLSSILNL